MTRPLFVKGSIHKRYYDGIDDDLLTAGVGQEGLKNYVPTLADPENPTAAELRRGAIAANYKALVDLRTKAGYGTLYGPTVAGKFGTSTKDGKVAGKEYIAYSDDGSGKKKVTMMVQIPDSFDRDNPCILATAASGCRGAYGAISVGEWGLKNRCAVVYTDKGAGVGVRDLYTNTVNRMDGTRGTVAEVGEDANFLLKSRKIRYSTPTLAFF